MKFFKSYTPFQKVFFVFFMIASIITFFVPAFISGGKLSDVLTIGGIVGLVATLSGVVTSVYQVRGNLIVYFWWIINTVAMLAISIMGCLYGQAVKTIILTLPLQIIGLVSWKRSLEKTKGDVVQVKRFKKGQWPKIILALIVCWFLYMLFIKYLPYGVHYVFGVAIKKDPSLIMDSISGIITTFAFYLTSKRYVEQWIFWIFSNIGFVLFVKTLIMAPHFSIVYLSGSVMWAQYLVSSFYGYYNWKKLEREQNNN
ncbi:nicotinamide mononucleotide transporter PnuC [Clostridium thermobutyricum]|uniref:Nicotinamide mononucleotide transporter PnuC n=2 Tax=Clostridium thermobutyricum TaxID=29372 RepID=N9XML6_9CLOT|nr:nicotinamide mononucleotide transporter PnuC [Clostridium thermobutyricum]